MPRQMYLGEWLYHRVGFRKAGRVAGLLFAYSWWIEAHNGEAPTLPMLAGDSDRSEKSFYRDLDVFREAFPGEETPERIARLLLAASKRRKMRTPATVFAVPSSGVVPA